MCSEENENSSQHFSKAQVLRLSTLESIPIPPKTGRMAQSQKEPLMKEIKCFYKNQSNKQKTYIMYRKPRFGKVRED